MLLSIVLLAVGLAILIGGADLLVRGVSSLAERFGVPPLVVGMTVVAFGTSTPELVLNTLAAVKGETGLAFGNIVGSCAINIGFVLALTAIIRPLIVETVLIIRELPMMLLGVASIVVMAEDHLSGGPRDELVRADGIMLLLVFGVFLYYTIFAALGRKKTDAFMVEVAEQAEKHKPRPPWIDTGLIIIGIAGVAGGGRLALAQAVSIASSMGVPDSLIGFTLVSFGTTLPELATCITAARRGQSDIALGNVVGSNIFNLLFIGGVVATIHPMAIPPGGHGDVALMAGLSAALLPIAIRGPRRITRGEGVFLLIAYLSYVVYRATTTGSSN
ncbi:MAG: K+-dependent Na+/Ca+ exchanger [Planctomycetota bacterium]